MSEMKIKLIQNRIDDILKYLKPLNALANCHMVEYVIDDHFKTLIPPEIVTEINQHGAKKAVEAFWIFRDEISKTGTGKKAMDTSNSFINKDLEDMKIIFKHLYSFIMDAYKHCLKPDRELCFSTEDFQKKLNNLGADTKESLRITQCTSDKKSHEVEVLSSMVATLSSWTHATHTVDLGGGKGFLSSLLTMLFKMKVLNIDCSPANAVGAEERYLKLQKSWPAFQRRAEQLKLGIPEEKRGRSRRRKMQNKDVAPDSLVANLEKIDKKITNSTTDSGVLISKNNTKNLTKLRDLNVNSFNNPHSSMSGKCISVANRKTEFKSTNDKNLNKNFTDGKENDNSHNSAVPEKNEQHAFNNILVKDSLLQRSSLVPALPMRVTTNKIQEKRQICQKSLYRHSTKFITPETDLVELVTETFEDTRNENIRLSLTGLHTCGDLGSSALRVFQRCTSSSIICAVPCCYNLIKELEDDQPFSMETIHQRPGFPMSYHLTGFTIGRNARMLASQSVDRVSASREKPSMSLYYRALLEVILRVHGIKNYAGKMRQVGLKCKDFSEYMKLVMETIKNTNIEDGRDWDGFLYQYKSHEENFEIFYLLRMCLAPVIESLILLDRLMFLAENGFANELGDSFIVKMFDPVISPRCHALVAYRKKSGVQSKS